MQSIAGHAFGDRPTSTFVPAPAFRSRESLRHHLDACQRHQNPLRSRYSRTLKGYAYSSGFSGCVQTVRLCVCARRSSRQSLVAPPYLLPQSRSRKTLRQFVNRCHPPSGCSSSPACGGNSIRYRLANALNMTSTMRCEVSTFPPATAAGGFACRTTVPGRSN